MNLVRALYTNTRPGEQPKRGYQTHYSDNGFPLCRCKSRRFTCTDGIATTKWLPETGSAPTCSQCKKALERLTQQRGGAA